MLKDYAKEHILQKSMQRNSQINASVDKIPKQEQKSNEINITNKH